VRRWPRPWTSEREQRADLRRKRGIGVEAGEVPVGDGTGRGEEGGGASEARRAAARLR